MLLTPPRPYQDEAIDAALARGKYLLAYEQGLGKTLCALAVTETLLGEEGPGFVCAIVVPANLKYQWAKAIAQHTDVPRYEKITRSKGKERGMWLPSEDVVVVIDGDGAKRDEQYRRVAKERPDYVILGYENVVQDWNLVRRIKPNLICLDEATAIKTFKAARTKKIKRWTAPYRLALTGTPIENGKPEELFSIMQWVDDTVLGRWDLYDKAFVERDHFGGVAGYKNLPVLFQKLRSVMSRKRKEDPDVAPYMPDVDEETILVPLTPAQREAYEDIGFDLYERLLKLSKAIRPDFDLHAHYHGETSDDRSSREKGEVMARLQTLEMLIGDPRLVARSAEAYQRSVKEGGDAGSAYCAQVVKAGILDDIDLEAHSSKVEVLVGKVQEILERSSKSKIVVFSFHRAVAGYLADALAEIGVNTVAYHGEMTATQKQHAVSDFETQSNTVLLCSHAGAFGTDLYFADYLINFDLAWSSGTQDQINARHVRAASLFDKVFVINLLAENTIEERKPLLLAYKRRTASAIIDNDGADYFGRVTNDVPSLTDYLAMTLGIDDDAA